MAKPVTWVIIAAGVGYSVAITLAILGCTTENTFWLLFLFAPYVFTPAMLMFIPSEFEDYQFWTQFAFFVIAVMLVTAFAMPLVFYSNEAIGLTGLGYGLGASFSLYTLGGVAIYCAFAPES